MHNDQIYKYSPGYYMTFHLLVFSWKSDEALASVAILLPTLASAAHDDVIKWKHFPRYWPFVRGIHRSPVNSLHKGQWRGALMFSLICARINGWVNNREAGDLWRYRGHYDVIVMIRKLYSNGEDHSVDSRLHGQTVYSRTYAHIFVLRCVGMDE